MTLECEPACNPVAHEVCGGDIESPTCNCAPGYSGIPCEWTGVLEDPSFKDQGAWDLSEGANVLPNETDSVDGGVAFFASSVACNAGAVSQTVEMPSYDVAEPLVAELRYRAQELYGLSIGFNRAWTQLQPSDDDSWRVERVCLGEAAYGGPVTIRIGSREQHFSCFGDPVGEIEVDQLEILPAGEGECPVPGEVVNGTGDVEQGGWVLEASGMATAELADGVGRGGTSGVRLAREGTDGNDFAFGRTTMSVPTAESLSSPALRFWWRGTNEVPFTFQLGRFNSGSDPATSALPLDDVFGNGSDVNTLYCLPPWTHGNVVDFIATVSGASSTPPGELVIDDMEIVSDPRCGTSTDVLDPGFDAGPSAIGGVINFTPFQAATLRDEPSLSRLGDSGVLEISYWNESAIMFLETWVFVPESEGEAGPALFYWSKVPQDNPLPIRSVLGRAAVDPANLPEGGGWQQSKAICLPSKWSGRWFRFQWRLGAIPPIGNASIEPPVRIYIDDLELGTSLDCPPD